jgi:hypothetical protein
VGGGGSTSPLPPHTSQRRWPTPSHFLQFPIVIPAIIRFPVPLQARQALVLWPWHLGHKTLSGIICFLRYLLMKIWDEAALGRWGKGLTSPRPPRSQSGPLKREEGTPYSGTVLCSANAALRWIKFLSENDQVRYFHLERAALRAMAVRRCGFPAIANSASVCQSVLRATSRKFCNGKPLSVYRAATIYCGIFGPDLRGRLGTG